MFLTLWNRPDHIYYQFNKHRGITCDIIQMVLNYESGNKGSSHKQVAWESTPEEVRAGGPFGIGRIWEKGGAKDVSEEVQYQQEGNVESKLTED